MKLTIKRSQLFSMKGENIPFHIEEVKKVLSDTQKKNISKMINEIKGEGKNEK